MNASISLTTLFWLCSGIGAIIGIYKIAKQPFVKLDDHETRLKHLEKMSEERKSTDILLMKSLNAITNHMIDGNGIDKLREARDELQREIIEHHR